MPDENAVRFVFHRPSAVSKSTTLPCVVYLHGGGMVAQSCFYAHYRAWARLLARQGLAVLLVDFRNALIPGIVGSPDSSGQVAPYPAGLNDCVSSVRWLHANAARLIVDPARIVVAGESGGGNLAIATALRLKRDGEGALLSGVYAMCPYLLGSWPDAKYPSTAENQGILLTLDGTAAHLYGRSAFEARTRAPGRASPRRPTCRAFPARSSRSTNAIRCAMRASPSTESSSKPPFQHSAASLLARRTAESSSW